MDTSQGNMYVGYSAEQEPEVNLHLQALFINKLTCWREGTPLKNLTVHSIASVHKIYSANSGFVTG